MGGRVASSMEPQKRRMSFTAALASAIFEWLLIFMLLVYGIFGYIITKFARYCDLPIPCLLCSRIDHIVGSGRVGVYRDMICKEHKLEMSSLVFCHFHEKLVDVCGMCESCLVSFATKDKSNAETYRLLVGKLGTQDIGRFKKDSLLDDDDKPTSSGMKHCSCCNELCTSRSNTQRLLQTRSTGFDASDLELPLSCEFFGEREKEVKTSQLSAEVAQVEGKAEEDSPVHLGYSELKITSDTDSEIQLSDNEENRALISNDPLRDLLKDSTPVDPFITMSEDDSSHQEMNNTVVLSMESSQILSQVQSGADDPHVGPSVASSFSIGHGLEELNWQEIDQKIDQKIDPSTSTNPEEVNDATESSNARNISVNISENACDIQEAATAQVQETDKTQELEVSKITTDLNGSKTRSDNNGDGLQLQIPSLDLVDAYKLAISSKGRQLSSKLSEQLAGNYSPRVSGDLKLLLSQLSQGVEYPGIEIISPRISRNLDELKTYDSSASIGMKLLQKRLSLERNYSKSPLDRNESGFESLDFSAVSEVEGESELDRLKRQLEYDRKIVTALLKELEEERNASAIATNEAMAMMTRLQEEKAALQMEASQGIRMMEEQAEYDMEALDKLNELVAEKDREIQDLEAELEYFRTKYPNESFSENEEELGSNVSRRHKVMSNSDLSTGDRCDHGVNSGVLEADSGGISNHSLLEIDDEREYISRCLSILEKKLNLLSSNGKHRDSISGDHLEKQEDDSCDSKLHEEDNQINEVDDNNVISQKYASASEGSLHKEADIIALGYELCNLSERLQAIEADKSFIEHAINTLKNGEEGLIQEIASHLRELRRIGIRRHEALPKD